ncbi:P-loop containing nucleoside triphosphate hydrolase protein [Mycena metata]|uniref:P-loop containing nucleoside triphosphate hydrolase protein n=1 Tax=Mycena metata TaxID=1033252 RepID=A0AAD7K9P2_9AGAR|nr:P-loop containing nucleoside triphosphate hydrolase protein [Mycena metata]
MAVHIRDLSYAHNVAASNHPALDAITLNLPPGSRTVIVGPNGGLHRPLRKSTLLQILAGKRLVNTAEIRIKDRDVFRDSPPGVTFLGTEWAMNPVVRSDIVVSHFLDSVGGYRHKERRDKLLDLLRLTLTKYLPVQLVFGLMAPFDVDLDVLVREELVTYLKNDSEARGATILYATHIFDGLNAFPTHIAHMSFGRLVTAPSPWPLTPESPLSTQYGSSTLYQIALQWLREDREYRRDLEKQGRKLRGARRDETVPSDSETFYRKYEQSPLGKTGPQRAGHRSDLAASCVDKIPALKSTPNKPLNGRRIFESQRLSPPSIATQ